MISMDHNVLTILFSCLKIWLTVPQCTPSGTDTMPSNERISTMHSARNFGHCQDWGKIINKEVVNSKLDDIWG